MGINKAPKYYPKKQKVSLSVVKKLKE